MRSTFNCLRQFALAAEAVSQRQRGCLGSTKSHIGEYPKYGDSPHWFGISQSEIVAVRKNHES